MFDFDELKLAIECEEFHPLVPSIFQMLMWFSSMSIHNATEKSHTKNLSKLSYG